MSGEFKPKSVAAKVGDNNASDPKELSNPGGCCSDKKDEAKLKEKEVTVPPPAAKKRCCCG